MKIIFLDIDGVLNSEIYFRSKYYLKYVYGVNNKKQESKRSKEIDAKAVKLLNKIIKETDAKIVVSSTWRKAGLNTVREELKEVGCIGEIIDITPSLSTGDYYVRGNEIYEWLKRNIEIYDVEDYYKYKNYVIIDDDSDMLCWQKDNFVKTENYFGLTIEDANRCIEILNQ